ncbi:MAG: CHASE2 domain-containing protein, partial [Pseudomonadota bacterium]|nr:CHASE2 domain-containing protein [Pseudomonadota bacterium]
MSFARPVWLPVATLGLTMLLMQLPLQRQLSRAIDDGLLRESARPSDFHDLLVVDFDDASLRALQPQLGPWPYSRAVHARLLQTLRKAGAALVVFDIVFA